MASSRPQGSYLKAGSGLALTGLAAWLLLSSGSTDHHEQPAPREFINRQGYKPVLRARQGPGSPAANGTSAGGATSGGNGSIITTSNGTTITYNNPFNGTWASAPGDFSARAQARSPALDEVWDWNENKTYGVNLGGWLVTEPFIVPNVYIPYQNTTPQAVDEYTLSQALGDDLADYMTQHYETFITEQDFVEIVAAGMNWIRLPVPFWMVDVAEGEPYLEGVAWNYMIQAFEWARKYGLRVELDLHTVPGSQNGLNHSGRLGSINFLNGVMGIVNAQRTLNVIRILTETINRPEYRHVQLFNIVNEAYVTTIGPQAIREFYLEAYEVMRNITGYGLDKGPFMVIHDGFIGLNSWDGYLSGADRVSLESHYYFAFSPQEFGTSFRNMVTRPCQWWAPGFNTSTLNFGLTIGGEWSLAPNDCGLWLNAVNQGAYYDGTHSNSDGQVYGNCDDFTDVSRFSNTFKQQLHDFTLSNMDTFQNFMFWTWKTQRNLNTGLPYNPLWCYSCGLEYDYVPTDPALARGACQRFGSQYGTGGYGSNVPLTTTLQASMTGGTAPTSTIAAGQLSSYGAWPPPSLTNLPASNLPVYTATGDEPAYPTTLATPLSEVQTGQPTASGWYTTIAGCSYLSPYSGLGASPPSSRCTGNGGSGGGGAASSSASRAASSGASRATSTPRPTSMSA